MRKFIAFAAGVSISLSAQIHEINSIQEVKSYFPKDKQLLCIFDVDYTLTMPENPCAHLPNVIRHTHLYKKVYNGLSHDDANLVRMRMVGDHPSIVIEDCAREELEWIRSQGHYLMAFTASNRYHKGNGDWRADDLQNHQIDFETGSEKIAPSSEVFHRGALFANFQKVKGPSLIKFLKTAHIKPATIIAIDDKSSNLVSMEEELEKLGIHFIGLKYSGAKHYKTEPVSEERFLAYFKSIRSLVEQ